MRASARADDDQTTCFQVPLMDSQKPRVIAAVSQHWLVGDVPSKGVRIQDILKDGATEFIRLENVQVCPYAQPESCLMNLPEAVVPKSKIEFVVIPETRHEAPEKRRDNYTVRATTGVVVVLGRYFIQGELHLPNLTSDSVYTLTRLVGRFFPITRASASGEGGEHLNAPVVFANKDFVDGFYLGNPSHVESESAEARLSSQPEEIDTQEDHLLKLIENVKGVLAEGDADSIDNVNSPPR